MAQKIVISEFMDQASVDDLAESFEVIYDPALVDDPDHLLSLMQDADALIVRNRTQVRGALLDQSRMLKVVGRLGVGLDNIDLEACAARNITVCPASGANDLSVAEYVLTAALILLRGAYFGQSRMVDGAWPRQEMSGREGSGKRLGLVGFGSIARETAHRARALGFEIAAMDPFVPSDDPVWSNVRRTETLADLLRSVDVVSLHVPLTDETRNMIDAKALSCLPQGAVVINAARGGVVDETALATSLRAGHLGGAALDVFAEEPLTAKGGAQFSDLSNIILTPHIAGVTLESNVRVSALTATNVRRVLEERS